MGVNDLWGVLEPAGKECSLRDLRGKTLAVDTSVWLYQGQVAGKQLSLHLRNMFCRVSHMIRHQIRPVFVMEGPAHTLKSSCHWSGSGSTSSSFSMQIKESCQLLKALGVPVIESAGEGEATCAALNQLGLVDGVITEDSDAFLFGATVVYRHFSCDENRQQPLKCYTMERIKHKLSLDRQKLVAYALLAGCDFTPGVPGVGRATAVKLLQHLSEEEAILDRFHGWRENGRLQELHMLRNLKKPEHCRTCSHDGSHKLHRSGGCRLCGLPNSCTRNSPVDCTCVWHRNKAAVEDRRCELDIFSKTVDVVGFPDQRVIDAFLQPLELQKLSVRDKQLQWHRPNYHSIQNVLHWHSVDTMKHVLPMVTSYDMADMLKSGKAANDKLRPDCVLKMIVEKGRKKLVIRWHHIEDCPEMSDDMVTTEDRELFTKCFPSCVEDVMKETQRLAESKPSEARIRRKRKKEESKDMKEQDGLKQSSMNDFFTNRKKTGDANVKN